VRKLITAALFVGTFGLLAPQGRAQAPATPAPLPKGPRAQAASRPLAGWILVVDPGHGRNPVGGRDTGAIGVNGVSEDQNVLAIARDLAPLLRSEGADVVLTRGVYDPGPPPVQGLIRRVALAEKVHADLFLSIHQNDGAPRDHGVETFYDTPASRAFAEDIQKAMVAVTGLADLGVHRQAFYVLRNTTMPSALVEGGFLSNPKEAAEISSPAFHALEAKALNEAILLYAEHVRP